MSRQGPTRMAALLRALLRALVLAAGISTATVATVAIAQGAASSTAVATQAATAPGSALGVGAPGTSPAPATDSTSIAGGVARSNAEDPALEKRLVAVTKELRCLVCQNESIADSHAPLAVDMRNEIRAQLSSGMTDRQVLDFMVARYGNFVRFRPPLDWTTIALWFGPALLMVIGVGALVTQLRHRRTLAAARSVPALSDAERAALASLAAGNEDKMGNR